MLDRFDLLLMTYYNSKPTGWIYNFFIVLSRFKIRQRSVTGSREWHDLDTTVDQPFVPQLREHPPHTLHKGRVQGFIVVLKVWNTESYKSNLTKRP